MREGRVILLSVWQEDNSFVFQPSSRLNYAEIAANKRWNFEMTPFRIATTSHHRARQSPFELNGRSCSSNLFFSTRDRDYIAFRAAILARRQFFSSRARPMVGHKYAKLSRRCVNLPQRSLSFHFRSFLDFLHRLKRHTTLVRYKKF